MTTLADIRPRGPLLVLTVLNAVLLAGLYIAEACIAERHWLATLVTYAPQHLIGFPALLLTLASLHRRRWRLAATNAFLLCFFLNTMLGFNVPLHAYRHSRGVPVRLMTYNVHHCLAGVGDIAADVNLLDPDVVCFQETNRIGSRSDPVQQLKRALPGWRCASHGQLAVFSKWPIISVAVHVPRNEYWRVFLQVGLRVRGRDLNVVCVHLNTAAQPETLTEHSGTLESYLQQTTQAREVQISELLRCTNSVKRPVIIAGDFNTPPRGRIYHRMAARFQDSFRYAGWGTGYSFKSTMPVMRIDYIWASSDLRPVTCKAPALVGSDHRPVVADLTFMR